MAQAVTQNLENWQAKLDKILHEKNAFTDLLDKAEQKTGVRRLYLVLGKLSHQSRPNWGLASDSFWRRLPSWLFSLTAVKVLKREKTCFVSARLQRKWYGQEINT